MANILLVRRLGLAEWRSHELSQPPGASRAPSLERRREISFQNSRNDVVNARITQRITSKTTRRATIAIELKNHTS